MTSMTEIGDRVRAARVAAGLSQTALAGTSFSPSYISLIEAGRREPTDAALSVIAERVGTTSEYLRFGEDGPNEARARLELDFARIALADGDAVEAEARLKQLDLSQVTPRLRHDARFLQARVREMMGDLEGSVALLEPLYQERQEVRDWLEVGKIAVDLVVTYLEAGDLHRSVEVGEQAMTLLENAGLVGIDEHLRLGSALVWSYVERGDLLYASQKVADLIRVAEESGSARGRGSVYWNAAVVEEERGDFELAQRYTERALALLAEGENDRDVPRLRANYAWLLLRSDPPEPARALAELDKAEVPLVLLGSEGDRARVRVERARAYLLLGDPVISTEHAQAALEILGDKPRLETATALVALGDALASRREIEPAAAVYEKAAAMLGMMSSTRRSAQVWRDLGDRYLFRGQSEKAALAFEQALREVGVRPNIPTEVMSGNPLVADKINEALARWQSS